MKTKILYLLAALVLVSGCEEKQLATKLSGKVDETSSKIAALEKEVSALKNEIGEYKRQKALEDLFRDLDKFAYLTPGDEGYTAIRFDLGVLTVKLADIKPYANGSKITLQIGNTLSATINGLKATLDWGKVDNSGSPLNDTAKSKSVTLNESLSPGVWTKINITLDGVPPSELGFVRLKGITHSGISLIMPRK